MLVILSFILIIFSIVFFLMGYAYLNGKAEVFLMWSFTSKLEKVCDKEGYKKQQGKHSIMMGFIFLFVPISLYAIDRFDVSPKLLYLWLPVLASAVILNIFRTRKYF